MSARKWVPATRDDLKPGAVFVVMEKPMFGDGIVHYFDLGDRVEHQSGGDDDAALFRRLSDGKTQYVSLEHVTPADPLTSHAVAAAEIARLRAEVAALREALDAAKTSVEAVLNAPYQRIPSRTIQSLQDVVLRARAALATQETQP